jgi:hypothetical protein
MTPKHVFWITLAVVVVAALVGWFIIAPRQATAPSGSSATSTPSTASTTDIGGLTVNGQGAVVTETTTSVPKPATPALSFSADLNTDAKQALQIQWDTLTTQLKSAPTHLDLWLELGTVYKIAGQYDAAIAAWTYITKAATPSTAYVAWGNLGDLYLNFTHDYAKAAVAYQQALKDQPKNPDYQAGLKAAQSHL